MKSWKSTQEGKEILQELYDNKHLMDAISALGTECLQTMAHRLASCNPRSTNASNDLLIMAAELEGARNMLKSILDPIEEMGGRKSNAKRSN